MASREVPGASRLIEDSEKLGVWGTLSPWRQIAKISDGNRAQGGVGTKYGVPAGGRARSSQLAGALASNPWVKC